VIASTTPAGDRWFFTRLAALVAVSIAAGTGGWLVFGFWVGLLAGHVLAVCGAALWLFSAKLN